MTYRFGHTLAPKHQIHFLQRQPLGFRYAKPHKHSSPRCQQPKEHECAPRALLEQVRGDLPDDEIVHPITTRAYADTKRAITQGPDLRDQDPCAGTPAVAEVDDKEPNKDDGRPARGFVPVDGPGVFVTAGDDGDDEVAERHADGTDEHDRFATKAVDVENGDDGCSGVRGEEGMLAKVGNGWEIKQGGRKRMRRGITET